MLIDSHCHLDFPGLHERLNEVIAHAEQAGIGRFLTISTHVSQFETYKALAEKDRRIFFSIGTHPHQALEEPDIEPHRIEALARYPRCIAIGETGLDYFYDKSPRDIQRRVFRHHIAAARASGIPLVVHARDADAEMMDIFRQEHAQGPFDAVLHCFSSGEELAKTGIQLGFYVSFSGILTFKKSDELRRIAAGIPLDRLLVETDAPYLAPEPFRGKTNEPAYVTHTAAVLAKVKGVSAEEIAARTTENFYRLFRKAAVLDRNGQAS